ncbi:MAG: M81 family metallopeptidase [Rhodospirillaceae bacterium]|nr:M81 family metallopeptidase [Rhodospirillaceae bacterium]
MARIAVAGFHHETNTFAPTRARYEDFVVADAWPGLTRGDALFDTVRDANLPVAGFIAAAAAAGYGIAPLLWCAASPSAAVEEAAYERIVAEILDRLAEAGPLDAIFLDLHGAMVTTHLEDGEGELLRRLRRKVGDKIPIVVSLDFHANVTDAMVEHATALVGYRTYPHVDMAETGARAMGILAHVLGGGALHAAKRKLPFLIPLNWQCTLTEPAAGIFRALAGQESASNAIVSLSFLPGFPPADIRECGPMVLAYAILAEAAEAAATELERSVTASEEKFAGRLYQPDEAVAEAMRLAATATKPVVIADTQDNPGAGANGDTVGMLEALVAADAQGAVFGLLCDPSAADAAHRIGAGHEADFALGALSGLRGHHPFEGRFFVEAIGDGQITGTGPFYRGSHMQLGRMACLRLGGVQIVVTSRKQQAADQAMFRHVGVDPTAQKILVLKSSVHFRADFEPIASHVLVAAAPGPNEADHRKLKYRRLRAGVRLTPSGPVHNAA